MLQTLNMLENVDLRSMGYNSARYIHTLYQAMNLAFADRDFYYGDPYVPPVEPIKGLLSKEYARERFGEINWQRNDPFVRPGDPVSVSGRDESVSRAARSLAAAARGAPPRRGERDRGTSSRTTRRSSPARRRSRRPTPTAGSSRSRRAAAGCRRSSPGNTGFGLSQRMQSFVLDQRSTRSTCSRPGKRPRATLSPSMALRDGKPFFSFAVQGGDAQDQNLLQFFLNIVEFGMSVQQAVEAANVNSYQMHDVVRRPHVGAGPSHRAQRHADVGQAPSSSAWAIKSKAGSARRARSTRSSSIARTARLWGGSSDFGEDYGIAW